MRVGCLPAQSFSSHIEHRKGQKNAAVWVAALPKKVSGQAEETISKTMVDGSERSFQGKQYRQQAYVSSSSLVPAHLTQALHHQPLLRRQDAPGTLRHMKASSALPSAETHTSHMMRKKQLGTHAQISPAHLGATDEVDFSYNFTHVWQFSQGSAEVGKTLQAYPHLSSRKGICGALSALWIERRAHGSSLRAHLEKSDGTIDLNQIRRAIQLHNISVMCNPGAMIEQDLNASEKAYGGFSIFSGARRSAVKTNQTAAFTQWLVEQKPAGSTGMHKLTEVISESVKREGRGHEDFVEDMAKSIVNEDGAHTIRGNLYKQINIFGKASGHSMAISISKNGTVAFFDPNVGEIHFPNKDNFIDWWPLFLGTMRYEKMCEAYKTVSFGLPPKSGVRETLV